MVCLYWVQVPLPDAFAVREAFNSKNWKGQVAFTAAARVRGRGVPVHLGQQLSQPAHMKPPAAEAELLLVFSSCWGVQRGRG